MTDYAIRIVFYLASTKKIIASNELSKKLGIPKSMVFKIGKKLKDDDIIDITTGIQGGFILKKQPGDVSLFDIIKIFEPTTKINRCLEGDKYCSVFASEHCPVRNIYCQIQQRIEDDLKNTKIKDLL